MPNGGHICCEYCTYNREEPGSCDIFGVETSPFVLCRCFRKPGQSHTEVRKEFPLLNRLKPGTVYAINNEAVVTGNVKPIYRVVRIDD